MRTILITGCSSGIGYDAAHALRDRGWRVFASCRKAEDCARLQAEGFDSPRLDYDDPTSVVEGLAETLEATGGKLDALYNNGAYGLPALVEDVSREAMEAIFQTNFLGVHDLTQRTIPVMRRQGHGRIVNCSSVLGFMSAAWRGPYAATKYAVEAMSDALRLELKDTGIKVILIEPGPIGTTFRQNAAKAYERWITPEASARAEDYRTKIETRLYRDGGKDPFELPASAVTAKLIRALEHPRPKTRYFVTTATYLAAAGKRVLPTWASDRLLANR